MELIENHAQFFTATIKDWKHLLSPDKYKDIIIESFTFLVNEKRVFIYAFVIMSNHLHVIWQMREGWKREDVQRDFLKYVSGRLKDDLITNHPLVLAHFKVKSKDSHYQFWKRRALGIDLYSDDVFFQKLNYIHNNPVRAGLCSFGEEYPYSSAGFYVGKVCRFEFLTHYQG